MTTLTVNRSRSMFDSYKSLPADLQATIRNVCQNALDVQDACNLSGVIHSFGRDISALWDICRAVGGSGTDWVNTHPACVLYADKINSLSSGATAAGDGYGNAWSHCYDVAKSL